MSRPRAYLAGPDVFLPDAIEIGREKKRICSRYGLEGVFPLDATLDLAGLEPPEQGYRCFDALVELMRGCDLAIANLTPFRGPGLDAGTALEAGYMHALGKPVFGYTNVVADYADRVEPDGLFIERFGLVDNLMVEGVVVRSGGGPVVRFAAPPDRVLRSLEGFERCVARAAEDRSARPSPGGARGGPGAGPPRA